MPKFRAVFPCGHENIQESTHMYWRKCCGERPNELYIEGELATDGSCTSLQWHFPMVHPVKGKVFYNGELVYGEDV